MLTVGPGISDDNPSKVWIKYGGSSGVDASDTGQENGSESVSIGEETTSEHG